MSDTAKQFDENGYVHLPNFLDKENCKQYVQEFRNLVALGYTRKDQQCPLSESIHGSATFDSLLEQLHPYMEQATGKRLHPTYSYARIYAPDDVLRVHIDRPPCEISATITLGFSGKQWPIYMADLSVEGDGNPYYTEYEDTRWLKNEAEIVMDVGDAVIYKGCDKYHWRNKFEGEWQAQVFLHYVDADGPHAEWKYDKRPKLTHHKDKDEGHLYKVIEGIFSPDTCAKIISTSEQNNAVVAKVGSAESQVVDKTVRDVKQIHMPTFKGIGATMSGIGLAVNRDIWQFDITHANQCDYLMYDKDGHYRAHIDTFFKVGDTECRKLTVLAFLNNEYEGGRFFLQIGDMKIYPPQDVGNVIVFPSFLLHGVEPVTHGVRRTIVTWMVGPWFK